MPRPLIRIQDIKRFSQTDPQGVEMNIADQLKKIRFFLTNNRFVAILEEMTAAVMAQVEDDCIPDSTYNTVAIH